MREATGSVPLGPPVRAQVQLEIRITVISVVRGATLGGTVSARQAPYIRSQKTRGGWEWWQLPIHIADKPHNEVLHICSTRQGEALEIRSLRGLSPYIHVELHYEIILIYRLNIIQKLGSAQFFSTLYPSQDYASLPYVVSLAVLQVTIIKN